MTSNTSSPMEDLWPSTIDGLPSDKHCTWTFVPKGHDLVTLCVREDQGVGVEKFDIHVTYVPCLACMDIEYWKAIYIPETNGFGVPLNKSIVKQRYMQDLRRALVGSLRRVEKVKLQDGSWEMDICNGWGIRTWNNFTHSNFGRQQYEIWCHKKNKVPYDQTITKENWRNHFLSNAANYQLVEERFAKYNTDFVDGIESVKPFTPFEMLRSMALWPMAKESTIQFYRNRSLGDLVSPLLGSAFPLNVDTVKWSCGRVTALPWQDPKVKDQHYDSIFVRKMATWADGIPQNDMNGSSRFEYIVIDLPKPPLPSYHLDDLIRSHLGNGRCILVRGETLHGPTAFSHPEIRAYKGSLAQMVEWQDAAKRAADFHTVAKKEPSQIHSTCTLKEFIDYAHDPTVCGNLLDMKATMASMSGLITRLADDSLAWNMTHHECHAHMSVRTSHRGKAGSPPTAPKVEQQLVGPQAIRYDTGSMVRWSLLTHGGYVTYPHKDANGLCTWIFAHTGVKIWAILEPKYVSPNHDNRRAQFVLHSKMMHTPQSWDFEEHSGRYSTFLAPGDMLIMPPGTWHAVYTATPSQTDGGHLFMYDTLHLTEFSRAFDHQHSYFSTNSNHQVDRILCRMTLALPIVTQTQVFYRRPILALARMLLATKSYVPQSERGKLDLKLHSDDVLAREEHFELLEAQRILRHILQSIGVSEAELQSQVEGNGMRWYERGVEIALPTTNISS